MLILTLIVYSQSFVKDSSEKDIKKLEKSSEKEYYLFFYDLYTSPYDIESIDSLKLEIAEYIFPIKELLFDKEKYLFKKAFKYRKMPVLMTEEEMTSFSEELFDRIARRKEIRKKEEEEEKKHIQLGFEEWETKIVLSGGVSFRAGYGFIWKDPAFPSSFPGITYGLNLQQMMRINILGRVGERVNISVDHNSESPENTYEIAYKALEGDKGFIKEVRAGNVELNIPKASYFIKYQGTSKDNYGIKTVLKYGDIENQTVISLIRSKKGYKRFVGKRKLENVEIMDVSYIKRKYFVLPDTSIDSQSLSLYRSTSQISIAEKIIDGKYFIRLKEGMDYSVDFSTGEIYLSESLSRDNELLVRYTHHGGKMFSTNSTDAIGFDEGQNQYLYLWKSDRAFSRFLHNGYYSLPYKNFDPSYGFNITVVYTYNKTQKADFQISYSDFLLLPDQGILKFRSLNPFPDPDGKIYSNFSDPSASDSTYTMQISFFREVSSYQLDFNVIPGTERVYINGRLMSPSEYRLISTMGEIYFNNPAGINENDVIEIYYEYKPFFSGSQKLSLANRFDYKPNNIINIGNTLVYSILQRDIGAPLIDRTPDALLMADIDGTLKLARLFNLPEDLDITLRGEYALSYYDPNSFDYAILEDFENIGESYGISKDEALWILCAPTTNIDGITYYNRGKLLYKDYRVDNWDSSVTPLNFNVSLPDEKLFDYSFKPGPYVALGGHLDPAIYPNLSQFSLIFDYDFRNGGDWVGAAHSVGDGPSGINLQGYDEITIWAKLQSDADGNNIYEDSGDEEVELYIALGRFNEDSDNDDVFDFERSATDPGYSFNNPLNKNVVDTYVGRGRKGGGDGILQTEDLNKNGVFDKDERLIVIPSKQLNTDITNIVLSQGGWKKITINIKSLTDEQINIMNHVTSIGIFIKKKNGAKGRVIIDNLEFRKIVWKEKRIDGIMYEDSKRFLASMVSSYLDPLYASKRFYMHNPPDANGKERLETFEKLHGYKSDVEAAQLEEKALYIRYDLTNIPLTDTNTGWENGTSGLIYKRTSKAYNISLYNTLSFYFYLLERNESGNNIKSGGDSYEGENLILLIGNSENSYYKWRIPLQSITPEEWKKASIDIRNLELSIDNSSLRGIKPQSYGEPNLRNVQYIAIGVENTNANEPVNKGALFINEMYTYLDKTYTGSAYYTEGVIEYKKPLLTINQFEIIGPLALKSSYEDRGLNFISSENNSPENFYKNFFITHNSSFIKKIAYDISYQNEYSGTETNTSYLPLYLQMGNSKQSYKHNIIFKENEFIPSISHSFTEIFETKLSRNLISMETQDYVLANEEVKYNASSKFGISENIPIFNFLKITSLISWENTLYLYDYSNFTNETYITNFLPYGMKSYGKILSSQLGFQIFSFSLSGEYEKSIEKYNKIFSAQDYKEEFQETRNRSFFERYGEILSSMTTGFYFPESPLYKLDKESYRAKFGGTPDVSFFRMNFLLDDKLSREANAFIYDNKGELLARYERYSFLNSNKLSFYFKKIIESINFNLERNLNLGYQSLTNEISLSNALNKFAEIYYYQPVHYNPYLMGDIGRKNSLILVSNYNISNMQSSIKFNETCSLDFSLTEFKNFLDFLLPSSYLIKSYVSTERNFQSYSQWKEGLLQIGYTFRISDFLSKEPLRIGDLKLDLSYKNRVHYNERKNTDEYTGSIYQNIWFNLSQNLTYNISLTYLKEKEFSEFSDFDQEFGFGNTSLSTSPSTKWVINGSFIYNWEIKNLKELDIGLAKLPLSEQTIANKEGITISSELLEYDGVKFSRYLQKLIEITFVHETQYRFSDYITLNFIFKFLFNQYNEVIPLEDRVDIRSFEPGYALQVGVDVRITF